MHPGKVLIALACLVLLACSRGVTEEDVRRIIGEYAAASPPEERVPVGRDIIVEHPSPTPRIPPGTKDVPFPLGTTGRIETSEHELWDITVLETNPAAAVVILDYYESNYAPRDEFTYFMIRLKVTYRGGLASTFDELHKLRVASAEGGQSYTLRNDYCGVGAGPKRLPTEIVLAEPGTIEGNICFEIPSHDVDSLVFIVEGYTPYGSDYWWFSLEKPSRQ